MDPEQMAWEQEEEEKRQLECMQVQSNHPALQEWTYGNHYPESEFPDAEVAREDAALKHNSTLTMLHVAGNRQQLPREGLLHFIRQTTKLKSLCLRANWRWQDTTRPHSRFVRALCQNESVENLECDSWQARDVAILVHHLPQLKELTLNGLDDGNEYDRRQLAMALKAHPNLVSLQYNRERLLEAQRINSWTYLELDHGHTNLRDLTLAGQYLSSNYLKEVLQSPSCPLHQLAIRLTEQDITHADQSYSDILDGLESNKSLLSFTFEPQRVPIQVHQARRFQHFLAAKTCSLKTLSLEHVRVLDGENTVPIDSMVGSNALTHISLSNCQHSANLWGSLLNNSINSITCHLIDIEKLEPEEFDSVCQAIAGSVTSMKSLHFRYVEVNSAAPLTQIYAALRQSPCQLSSLCLYLWLCDDGSLAVEGLCHLFQRTTTAQCEIQASKDLIEHCQLQESGRGLRNLEINGVPAKSLMLLLHALTLNASLETLEIRHEVELDELSEEDQFPALILHLPNIKGLRKFMFWVSKESVVCAGVDNLLRALDQNTSLTSVVIQGALAPFDAEQERAFRFRVKSICRRNWGWLVGQVPAVVWISAHRHAQDSKNLSYVYSLISNRSDILDQGIL